MSTKVLTGLEHGSSSIGFRNRGANATINSTSPITGSYDLKVDLTANANAGLCDMKIAGNSLTGATGYEHWVSFHFKFSALPSAEVRIQSPSTDSTYHDKVTLDTDGKLKVYLGGILTATSANALSVNTTYWIRIKWYAPGGPTGGYCYVDVNGSRWVTATGAVTFADSGVYLAQNCPADSNFGTILYYDDIYVNIAAAPNSTAPEEIFIKGASGIADGDYENAEWTGVPDNTDKYKNWDEIPPNGTGTTDSDYNQTATADKKLSSAMPTATTMGINGKSIQAVILRNWGRRTNGNKEHHGTFLRINNSDALSGDGVDWADQNYAPKVWNSVDGWMRDTNVAGNAWADTDFNDWEIGWYTWTGQIDAEPDPHTANIRISMIMAEIAYYTPAPPAVGFSKGYIFG